MITSRFSRTCLAGPSSLLKRAAIRHVHSTNSPPSSPAAYKLVRYIAVVAAAGATGIWWLRTTRDSVPQFETPPTGHLVISPGPTREDVTRILSQGAYSFPVRTVPGVSRYDGARLASNSPCEDQAIHGKFRSPFEGGHDWMAWGVLDGHAGSQTANLLKLQLVPFVRHGLARINSTPHPAPVPQDVIQSAIVQGFRNLDNSIVQTALSVPQSNEPLQDKVRKLLPAYAGSCALLSMYDPATTMLHVACTGDSRAVFGQMNADGKWEALPLSTDQTGKNEEEIARLSREHPGEENIVKNGRVLGIMVSRAFGDGRWKWPLDFQQDMKERFYGPSPLTPKYDIQTPPYLTAEPVVTSTSIPSTKPSFIILATDGLWDNLTNQEAVDLVGKWLEAQPQKTNDEPDPKSGTLDFAQVEKGLNCKSFEEITTVQDGNAAVHLMRNSLGGNQHELVAGRLAFDAPFSRDVRDDMTVQVVFFNAPNVNR